VNNEYCPYSVKIASEFRFKIFESNPIKMIHHPITPQLETSFKDLKRFMNINQLSGDWKIEAENVFHFSL